MRFVVFSYRLPFSIDRFKIGSQYMFIQAMKSFNTASGDKLYEIVDRKITPEEQSTYSKIHPKRYPGKFVRNLVPKGCELVEERSQSIWPVTKNEYTVPNRTAIGGASMTTIVTPDRANPVPQEIIEIIGANKHTVEFFDMVQPNFQGPTCFVYRLLKFEVNMFGKSLVENAIISTARSVYKQNYSNAIKNAYQWSSLTENDMDKIFNGDIVKETEISTEADNENQQVE
ncbi:Phosphatidylinositol_transfer protein [Hexamita inflata]|uniref:Phosphatidylinositol transfer protein n=1 Tax=Hexamita inflata TaxID=28002 RepID=A0AA86ULJ6_9EUKA|nr:Phosphatidylinositol transfer protein [Hexamita inflata]